MGKVVKGIGKVLKGGAKLVGGLAKGASKIAGFIPGVGTIPAALLGGGGALLQGLGKGKVNIGDVLKSGAGAALPGALKGLAGKLGSSGLSGILKKGVGLLGGRGLPGSSGSLIQQLATAVPGVIGAVQKGKQQGRQNRLLQAQSDIYRRMAGAAGGLLDEAAPLRQGANAAIMARLGAGRPRMPFASDRLNPFTPSFNPAEPNPLRRRRPMLGSGTPFVNAAVGGGY